MSWSFDAAIDPNYKDIDPSNQDRPFNGDGFKVGDEIYAFGFTANNGKFTIIDINDYNGDGIKDIKVLERLAPGDGSGDGNEALVTQGSRGKLLDRFYELRRAGS